MSGGLTRTLRLVDQAFAAEQAGDHATAERLFAEIARIGPTELAMPPEQEDPIAIERQRAYMFGPDGDGRAQTRADQRRSPVRTRFKSDAAGSYRGRRTASAATRQQTRPNSADYRMHHRQDHRPE